MRRRSGSMHAMIEEEFRAATLAILRDGVPSSGDDLLGMEMDFLVRLGGLDEIDEHSVRVQRTEHAERLVRVSCAPVTDVSPGHAIEAIRGEWLTNLRYGYTEVHLAAISSQGATLDFVTQVAPRSLYVTGQVEVQMPNTGLGDPEEQE